MVTTVTLPMGYVTTQAYKPFAVIFVLVQVQDSHIYKFHLCFESFYCLTTNKLIHFLTKERTDTK